MKQGRQLIGYVGNYQGLTRSTQAATAGTSPRDERVTNRAGRTTKICHPRSGENRSRTSLSPTRRGASGKRKSSL